MLIVCWLDHKRTAVAIFLYLPDQIKSKKKEKPHRSLQQPVASLEPASCVPGTATNQGKMPKTLQPSTEWGEDSGQPLSNIYLQQKGK